MVLPKCPCLSAILLSVALWILPRQSQLHVVHLTLTQTKTNMPCLSFPCPVVQWILHSAPKRRSALTLSPPLLNLAVFRALLHHQVPQMLLLLPLQLGQPQVALVLQHRHQQQVRPMSLPGLFLNPSVSSKPVWRAVLPKKIPPACMDPILFL